MEIPTEVWSGVISVIISLSSYLIVHARSKSEVQIAADKQDIKRDAAITEIAAESLRIQRELQLQVDNLKKQAEENRILSLAERAASDKKIHELEEKVSVLTKQIENLREESKISKNRIAELEEENRKLQSNLAYYKETLEKLKKTLKVNDTKELAEYVEKISLKLDSIEHSVKEEEDKKGTE